MLRFLAPACLAGRMAAAAGFGTLSIGFRRTHDGWG
jgi:hypothetical protein